MKAYSIDLRERVLSARENDGLTIREIAERYEVSEYFIKKMLKQKRELGHVNPLGHGGGQTAKLKENQVEYIRNQVEKQPDIELLEICQKVVKRFNVQVSAPTMCRILQKLGLPRKKKLDRKRAR